MFHLNCFLLYRAGGLPTTGIYSLKDKQNQNYKCQSLNHLMALFMIVFQQSDSQSAPLELTSTRSYTQLTLRPTLLPLRFSKSNSHSKTKYSCELSIICNVKTHKHIWTLKTSKFQTPCNAIYVNSGHSKKTFWREYIVILFTVNPDYKNPNTFLYMVSFNNFYHVKRHISWL